MIRGSNTNNAHYIKWLHAVPTTRLKVSFFSAFRQYGKNGSVQMTYSGLQMLEGNEAEVQVDMDMPPTIAHWEVGGHL